MAQPTRSIDDLDDAIFRLCLQINSATYRLLILVREFDDRLGWAKWSFKSCAEWLAWRCGLSLSAAREKVRTAHALRHLPAISAAFADGRLSYSKVRALTRVAHENDEDLLLAYALDATAAQVEERCRQIRNVAPGSVDVARRAWARRSLSISRNPAAGTLTITVELPVEEGELVANALDRAIEAGEHVQGPEFDANGWQAQQADALVAVARSYLGGGSVAASASGSASVSGSAAASGSESAAASMSAADHYQIVVHVDDSALRGGAGRSDLPIETVRRLGCDASLITLVEDGNGRPLDLGRKQRMVSTHLKRALWSRDRGCTFPGCHRTRFVDAHHVRHWCDGGETSLDNLTLLCSYHHRLLHEGAFRIRRDHEGAIYFQRRDGRVVPKCGYRIEDVLDDIENDLGPPGGVAGHSSDGLAGDTALADSIAHRRERALARLAAVVRGRNPSAEVREQRGIYRVDPNGPRLAGTDHDIGVIPFAGRRWPVPAAVGYTAATVSCRHQLPSIRG